MNADAEVSQAIAAAAVPVWLFLAAGAVLGVATLALIARNIAVSTGHSILIGAAAALLVFPFVSKFEWSETGMKYEARANAIELSRQLEEVALAQKQQNETIQKLAAELEVAAQNIEAFRRATPGSPGPFTNVPEVSPDVMKGVQDNAKATADFNKQTLDAVREMQKTLRLPRF
ncbi:hypothetical protein HFO38_30405 [Rhizobium leguminosarum]|uniref:hypothetical protein n=1 Tax=Rhizobium leguminosarum TaxID=384 RepID=UPI001C9864AC|nr:hypothetical protein [Rhizobium leguminosarum]MBY5706966.1 hypothetical protein [Rhizobium leguminosarum]